MQLKSGVLIIGSLFWDDGKNNIRKTWRETRLLMDKTISVQVPIRYGRVSAQRHDTYTMVLSDGAPNGSARVVPCKKAVTTFDDLIQEAQHLWGAETQKPVGQATASNWGCVALALREPASDLQKQWTAHAQANVSHYDIKHAAGEAPIVLQSGLVQMPWPKKVDEGALLTEVDALLVVANQPTLTAQNKYATPDDIAKAWLQHKGSDLYFYKNREHRIKTFEDELLLEEFWRASTGAC